MTNQEVDRRLALAIGYTADRVRTIAGWIDVYNKPFERLDGPYAEDGWQRFDHTDPAVIWPIAERFDAFPFRVCGGRWRATQWRERDQKYISIPHDNPATASALAVIAYVEGNK